MDSTATPSTPGIVIPVTSSTVHAAHPSSNMAPISSPLIPDQASSQAYNTEGSISYMPKSSSTYMPSFPPKTSDMESSTPVAATSIPDNSISRHRVPIYTSTGSPQSTLGGVVGTLGVDVASSYVDPAQSTTASPVASASPVDSASMLSLTTPTTTVSSAAHTTSISPLAAQTASPTVGIVVPISDTVPGVSSSEALSSTVPSTTAQSSKFIEAAPLAAETQSSFKAAATSTTSDSMAVVTKPVIVYVSEGATSAFSTSTLMPTSSTPGVETTHTQASMAQPSEIAPTPTEPEITQTATYTIHATETRSLTVTQPGPTVTVTAEPRTTQAADTTHNGATTDTSDDKSGLLTVIPITPSSGVIFVTKSETVTSWKETKTVTVTSWKETTKTDTKTVTATTTVIRPQLVT
ncbi:uncharacterized protein N7482_008512 [Penicillium canariense]|uniref:Uncharacterized protein n=1 Tax=Penicillium canariense TaxID=189055 RepID=A0A9W9HU27_9EURO|nr:uncharacterized protein N7482_008512 [Penicillium canariense]KAJ5157412.1 hypothetical protein N7482_008512 [Penicillium canariense]